MIEPVVHSLRDGVGARGGGETVVGVADELPHEFPLRTPDPAEHAAARRRLADPGRARAGLEPLHTVIGVVATDAPLDAVQAHQMAAAAQRGMARAVSPVHGPTDGDTVFALVPRPGTPPGRADDALFTAVLAAAELAFTRSVVHGVLAATSATTAFGAFVAYRDLYPGACADLPPYDVRPATGTRITRSPHVDGGTGP